MGRNHIPIMQNRALKTTDPVLYLYRIFVYPTVPQSLQTAIYDALSHRSGFQSKTFSSIFLYPSKLSVVGTLVLCEYSFLGGGAVA